MTSSVAQAMETLRDVLGDRITYSRGGVSLQVSAVLGSTKFRTVSERGATLITRSIDFLISATALASLPDPDPQEGDQIQRTLPSGAIERYEVVRFNGEPCWRWRDPEHSELRIHAKLIQRS